MISNSEKLIDEMVNLRKKLKRMQIVTAIIAILLVVSTVLSIIFIIKAHSSDVQHKKDSTVVDESYKLSENVLLDVEAKYNENKDSYIDCSFKVDTFNECEYLVVHTEYCDIYYQNEFKSKEDKDHMFSSFVSNEGKVLAINTDYDFENLDTLIPEYKPFNGSERLLFTTKGEEGELLSLTLYDISSFRCFGTINIENEIRRRTAVNAGDEKKQIVLSVNGTGFTYEIEDLSVYNNCVTHQNNALGLMDFMICEAVDENYKIRSFIDLGEHNFAGELDFDIVQSENGFGIENEKYHAYVPPTFDDYNNPRIATPIKGEPIFRADTTWGRVGGSYRFPLYKNVPLVPEGYYYDEEYVSLEETDDGFRTYTLNESGDKTVVCIDISGYQEDVNWKKVKAAGVDYAIMRVGYRGYSLGKIVEDQYFDKNIQGATEAGIKVGAYIFSQAINDDEAKEEAEFLVKKMKELGVTGPVIIDIEEYEDPADARQNLITRDQRTSVCKVFCETVKEAGFLPMIYANTKWFICGINWDEVSEYPVWFAYYGYKPSFNYKCDIWQYSCEGKVDGVYGGVDMSVIYDPDLFDMTYDEYKAKNSK